MRGVIYRICEGQGRSPGNGGGGGGGGGGRDGVILVGTGGAGLVHWEAPVEAW